MNLRQAEPKASAGDPERSKSLPSEFPAPWASDWGEDAYGLWMVFRYRGVRQCMRWIAPGEFLMGSPASEAERWDNETQHRVILTQGYWLADTACTQALWQAVMGNNPSRFQGEERPVERVSWDDVQQFIQRLNALAPSGGFRLPTEAEWENACRAGTATPFWFGEQITREQVNYEGRETVSVKALPCNGWGLYQMHGNVWEWCQDRYGDYDLDNTIDPTGPATGVGRVLRGGSWFNFGWLARSASRSLDVPGSRIDYGGFRLARGQAEKWLAPEAQARDKASSAGQTSRSGGGQARRAK